VLATERLGKLSEPRACNSHRFCFAWRCRLAKDFCKESGNSVCKAGPQAAPVLKKNLRRSERVFLSLRLRVSAPSERGEEFLGEGKTIDVSHAGASIMVDRDLRVGQTIRIQRVRANKEALARVVGCYKDHSAAGSVFGVALSNNQINPWDIVFPPAAGQEEAVLRSLLRCVACGRLEVTYLNEFESDLFLNHHSVPRLCGQCGGWTTWIRPYGNISPGSDASIAGDSAQWETEDPELQNLKNRSEPRLRTETVGCIRNLSQGNEVVLVSSLAREGVDFFSPNKYPEGASIEMAIPYTSRAPNIFSLVRIVRARREKQGGLTEYRAAYLV
jgi:hypothetical protein